MGDKKDFSDVSYTVGIISIVLAFFQPLAGLILGVIGFNHSKKQKTDLSKKAKKLNVIAIIISLILLVFYLTLSLYLKYKGINLPNFPTG
ncbi:hypothetical protein DRN69_00710 [Candidatus Pacearchaeota archaeon]|nr:MAG: hypothetical protein DRN69_00710 [Candidatus Pacearchaeota archaeon]